MSGEQQKQNLTGDQNPASGPVDGQNFVDGVVFDDGEELETEGATGEDGKTGDDKPLDQAADPNKTKPEGSETSAPAAKPDDGGGKPEDGKVDGVTKKINKLTFEKHEEARKREEVEAKLKAAQAEIDKLKGASDKIVIPPMPDAYDPQFEAKVAARDEAIQKKAAQDAQLQQQQQAQQQALLEKQQADVRQIQTQVDTMFTEGEKLGISKAELEKSDATVAQFITNQDLAKYVLAHKEAAILVHYLASSAVDLEAIGKMAPVSASVYIENTVLPKAQALKPKPSNAPDPIEVPDSGRPAGKAENEYLKGVTLE